MDEVAVDDHFDFCAAITSRCRRDPDFRTHVEQRARAGGQVSVRSRAAISVQSFDSVVLIPGGDEARTSQTRAVHIELCS